MKFGVGLMGYDGCWDDAVFAEEHGFDSVGFVDSPLLAGDPYACMALAARLTTKIRLGTFIGVPGNRNAPTTAAAIATINRLAPGRTYLGLGTGFTGRNTFGLPPVSVKEFRKFATECKELLAGDETLHSSGQRTRPIRFTYADDRCTSLEPKVPVYMAAEGPRARVAAAEVADGWITGLWAANVMSDVVQVYVDAKSEVETAATAAGRDFSDAFTMWGTGICVLEPGESAISPKALDIVGPIAMVLFHSWADNPAVAEQLAPPMQERLSVYKEKVLDRFDVPKDRLHQEIHRGHLAFLLDGEAEVLTEEIIRMTTLTGTAEEIAQRIRQLDDEGLDNISLYVPPHLVRQVVIDVEQKIMPLL